MFTLERVFFIIRINAILFLSFAKHATGKQFHFARRMKTDLYDDMTVYNFETLTGQGINDCIELCKRKKSCKFINYERRPNLCFLIGIKNGTFQIEDYLEVKPGFYFGDKKEWNMVRHSSVEELAVCERCSENGVCKIDDGSDHSHCLNSGCGPPEQKENTIVLGDMFSVGSKIEYECKTRYKTIENVSLRSVCLKNGTWSPVEVECVPEFQGTFYRLVREDMNWDSAKATCSSTDGHLVDIKSQEEQDFITETITVVDNFGCYWTGATRSSGGFIWLDGTVIEHENWGANQPNNAGNTQDCVELLSTFGYKWNDVQCSAQCHVICKQIYT